MQRADVRFYGGPSPHPDLAWSWVEARLAEIGTMWVVTGGTRYPHPRPVWGVWLDGRLHLSVGSPALRRALTTGAPATVHLDSGTEVVLIEGDVVGPTSDPAVIAAYDAKYGWTYDLPTYGPLTTVEPRQVLAWRTAGPAGRDGFLEAGRWVAAGTDGPGRSPG